MPSRPVLALAAAIFVAVLPAIHSALDAPAAEGITGVRLTGSSSPRQGLLEVEFGGKWYSGLCQAAEPANSEAIPRVACAQLGFPGGARLSVGRPPKGGDGYLSGSLECTGSETALSGCTFGQSDDKVCDKDGSEALFVGVVCEGFANISALRLAGGRRPAEGRVEARVNRQWGTICASPGNEAALAAVACFHLGYRTGRPSLYRGDAFFGAGDLPPAIDVQRCEGNETSLANCTVVLPMEPTNPPTACLLPAFGVACNGSEAIAGVRLAGGPSAQEGRLELQLAGGDGTWGGVCGTMLPQESALMAQVICRQLGLQGGSINDGSSYTTENGASDTSGGDSVNSDGSDGEGGSDGDGSKKKKKKKKEEKAAAGPPLLLSSVNCTGSEASLSECAFSLPSELDCPEGSVGVGVACSV